MSILASDLITEETAMATKRSFVLVLVLLFAGTLVASAQSNEIIDAVLGQDPATVGSAAYIALSAAGVVREDVSPARAFSVASDAGWLEAEMGPDAPATFGIAAHLLMQAFGVKGGLMYRIATGPRYAAREFEYQGWIPDPMSPNEVITGEFLLRMTGSFLESQEVAP
jgi:hypothetical protein